MKLLGGQIQKNRGGKGGRGGGAGAGNKAVLGNEGLPDPTGRRSPFHSVSGLHVEHRPSRSRQESQVHGEGAVLMGQLIRVPVGLRHHRLGMTPPRVQAGRVGLGRRRPQREL